MKPEVFRSRLEALDHGIPWTHHFEIDGVETITKERDEKFYRKSLGGKHIAKVALSYYDMLGRGRPLSDARILDVASAEGGNAIPFAQAGAKQVVGIEGRQLYIDRANLIAEAFDVTNLEYRKSDVRGMRVDDLGTFDLAIVFGILHHLDAKDFLPFLQSLGELTQTILLFTHLSTAESIKDYKLKGPVEAAPGLTGYLYREHKEDATQQEREAQVRASLDNTYSFWATDETLMKALKIAGFNFVSKIYEPHAFSGYQNRNFRVMYVGSKI